jgi:exonuclease SbcD
VGSKTDNPEDEVFILKDVNGVAEAIVCAVPFLRERDIRLAEPGESPDDKTQKLLQNISLHYKDIAVTAHKLQDKRNKVPVIGLGHLFTSNARTTEGDGVRELYIGTIAHIDSDNISKGFDYMALGHLHMAQKVNNSETVRYSGSPIPMGFAEAEQTKKIVVAEFNDSTPVITEHDVPCFQKLIQLRGDIDTVSDRIGDLKNTNIKAWLEIEITSQTSAANITALLDDLLKGSHLEILRIKNKSIADRALIPVNDSETLETMSNSDVFMRCLEANEIPEVERAPLISTYNEAIEAMLTGDQNAN